MTEALVVVVVGFVVIAAATVVGPRLGLAAPLLLVAIGVGASFLPVFTSVHIEPDLILDGVLPPLLYSSAVSMPSTNFRRELGAISGLSVLLVVGSALVLGVFFMLVVPDLGFAWGVALGAIVSPTDAVATSIIKQTSVSPRVVAMLDGESLLNDATALVILRTAVVATAASFSMWKALGTFGYSVAVAVVIGVVIGMVNLKIRKRVTDPTVNTVISFAVPFAASVPTTLLGASGLVAAVVAGLVTGYGAARNLSPQNRLSDNQNWRTVELVLEGAVFLTMGVQLKSIVGHLEDDHGGVGTAVLIALGALLLTVAVRAAYVGPLLGVLAARARANEKRQERFAEMHEKMQTPEGKQRALEEINASSRGPKRTLTQMDRFSTRLTQWLATVDYFRRQPLGWREGTVVVWAGMRGAVTVAAAQTLPDDTPHRSVLVAVAFALALLSLVCQGASIGPVVRVVAPVVDAEAVAQRTRDEQTRLGDLLRAASEKIPEPAEAMDPSPEAFVVAKTYRLEVLAAQRDALLDARDNGTFDAEVLESMLANLDASEIAIAMRGTTTTG